MKATPTAAAAATPWCTDDELDVRFFFSDPPAGPGSNLVPQLDALAAGAGRSGAVQEVVSDDVLVEQLDSAHRRARVERLLHSVAGAHLRVLAGAYRVDEVPPSDLRCRYGDELAGVVLVLFGADAEVDARERAEEALAAAQAAYAAARAAVVRVRFGLGGV